MGLIYRPQNYLFWRECDICKEIKLLDTENYIRQHESGFMHTCKNCLKELKKMEENAINSISRFSIKIIGAKWLSLLNKVANL